MKGEVAIFCQYAAPERSAASNRLNNFIQSLRQNYSLKVFSQTPHYPTGKIFNGYKNSICLKEEFNGFTQLRTWVVLSENSGSLRRSLNYISFFFSALLAGLIHVGEGAIVIGSSPQIFTACAAAVVAKFKRGPFILDVRDIWPESLLALSLMKRGFGYTLLEKMESWLYKNAQYILTVNDRMKDRLVKKGISEGKIVVLPNVVRSVDQNIKNENVGKKDGKIIVLYAGNHSKAQNISKLFEVVEKSQNGGAPIHYFFIGDGEEKPEIINRAKIHSLTNVTFVPQVSSKELQGYYHLSDICILSLLPTDLFYDALPTKMLEYMVFEKPVIFYGKNYYAERIEKIGAGVTIENGDSDACIDAILSIGKTPEVKQSMGRKGRTYINEHHSFEVFAEELNSILANL